MLWNSEGCAFALEAYFSNRPSVIATKGAFEIVSMYPREVLFRTEYQLLHGYDTTKTKGIFSSHFKNIDSCFEVIVSEAPHFK